LACQVYGNTATGSLMLQARESRTERCIECLSPYTNPSSRSISARTYRETAEAKILATLAGRGVLGKLLQWTYEAAITAAP
jgi:hypothetical protein